MLQNKDTICAIATPSGKGAIAIIRISGHNSISICDKIFVAKNKTKKLINQKGNTIHYGAIIAENKIIDEVLVSIFRNPNSYTGEDLIEISCHASNFIQQEILHLLSENGARLANPGEFTLQAFLNGKLDLSQAEGVADLIASSNEASHKVALNQMRGGFSNEISILRQQLLNFISLLELELDFSEEDVEFADRKELKKLVEQIQKLLQKLIKSYKIGNILKNGVPVAIVGEPNVGKSSLLNVLLNEDRAIVSEIPGTTRDIIEDSIVIEGITFRFLDTAGLHSTQNKIENIGIKKTYEIAKKAELILFVQDSTKKDNNFNELLKNLKNKKVIIVNNKIDILDNKLISTLENNNLINESVNISAKEKTGIKQLLEKIIETQNLDALENNDVIVTNARHYEALVHSSKSIERVANGLNSNISSDFISQDIREVLHYLGEITGEIASQDILNNIFEQFCIGK
ncbi:MAG: tRNA uridine-5-carboxymethylaminomethyl(34) synthesis GTPase MnmE [Bacteroidetes bacterium]|jgi:tRNA modification GTPase|nr:tRNA uridine-5-carboxymethylaminomethyl(34) synthesis GTPase MnmE [Bacteroidota bacterium]MBT6686260.1 tRNA uridine-5-carboxymethylaminomethyl(34) synthesis GTPase MnmE [Bacteroidota bacterium]MBT7142646.1 tRNA uridine-5-carboxymethylaminomethyl(34) synthesis GTPase MnmE [Bacteroidota bacterium]MBT7492768.1 tRNA uridine-5-carboxymethylaminomethyl(34) synthesis GTPase MnmE [Bacteroidota bacterium]